MTLLVLLACVAKGPEVEDDTEAPADTSSADDTAVAGDDTGPTDGPDLTLLEPPVRQDGAIVVTYCNVGTLGGETTVPLRVMDVNTTRMWERGGQPFPAPGTCEQATPVPCEDLGLDCAGEVVIEVVLDPYDAIRELDEDNNRGTFAI